MQKRIIFFLSFIFLLQWSFFCVYGSDEKVIVLGKYGFYSYYEYSDMTNYLKDMNKAYPQLTQLKSLCKSDMGRDVWMMIINNPKTGKAEDKPGFLLEQIHAGEVIASQSILYTIWYLLENYGKDEAVTKIVDHMVWYIVPRLDVDGAEAYLTQRPAGKGPNPIDDDSDGSFDEDPPEDIDGDGFLVQMRKKDPNGEFKVLKRDPRIMTRRVKDELKGTFYKIYTEGIDNDRDGQINEDSFSRGFLSNRNYPGSWRPRNIQSRGGRYPLEERITRAEVDFVANHPNIAIYVQHHCCGRVILRPPSTYTDAEFEHKGDLELYKIAAARSLEHSGWFLATSVADWVKDSFESAILDESYPPASRNRKSSQTYRDKDGKIRNAPRGMYPEEKDGGYTVDFCGCGSKYHSDYGYFAYGSSLETMYGIFGIFSFSDEHWSMPDYDKNGKITEEERLRWNDDEMDGNIFIDWHPFDHPTLGDIEIGGWRVERQMERVCPPEGELVEKECEMGNRFVIYLAGLAPVLKIADPKITDKQGGIYQVDITVENNGFLPTATEKAQALKVILPVLLEVEPDDNTIIIYGEKKVKLGQISGNSESKKITYILQVKNSSKKAVLKAVVSAPRAGKHTKDIVIQ